MGPVSSRTRSRGTLRASRSGAVAVIVATATVPICMLCGLVFDFGFVLEAKSQLDVAADAAALAAVRAAAAGFAAGQTPQATYVNEGTNAGNQWFTAQAGAVSEAQSFAATTVVTQNGQIFTATVTYTATVYEVMPAIFNWKNPNTGVGNASIANSSTASITVNAYGTIDFLLDNTSSMLLPQDNTNLGYLQSAIQTWLTGSNKAANIASVNASANGLVGADNNGNGYLTGSLPLSSTSLYCAFACHWSSSSSASNPKDYWGLAKQNNVKLRFDVVQSATITGIQEMETDEKVLGQLSVGVFAFGGVDMGSSATYLTTIFSEAPIDQAANGTTSKNAGGTLAINALSSITPPITGDTPNTNIGNALSYTLAITGPGGDGSTSQKPLKSMILITDGVEDDSSPQSTPSTEGPINPSVCAAVKNAGYTLYVLYTPYNSAAIYLPFNMQLQPYITGAASPSVLSALQTCASEPGDLIVATSPTDIQAGLTALVDAALVGATTKFTN